MPLSWQNLKLPLPLLKARGRERGKEKARTETKAREKAKAERKLTSRVGTSQLDPVALVTTVNTIMIPHRVRRLLRPRPRRRRNRVAVVFHMSLRARMLGEPKASPVLYLRLHRRVLNVVGQYVLPNTKSTLSPMLRIPPEKRTTVAAECCAIFQLPMQTRKSARLSLASVSLRPLLLTRGDGGVTLVALLIS